MDKKTIGKKGEDFACQYLQNKGFTIIERNWSCFGGEIDIIAKDLKEYVFAEVRTKKKNSAIKPIDTITFSKQKRIKKAIEQYMYDNRLETFARCDIVCVVYEIMNNEAVFNLDNHIVRIDIN